MAKKEQKQLALNLYIKGEHTRKDIAQMTGVSYATMCRWIDADGWDTVKSSRTITRAQLLQDAYNQLAALNLSILNENNGVPDHKQASVKSILVKEIETLSTTPLHIYLGVLTELTSWLFHHHPKDVKHIVARIDQFISAINIANTVQYRR